MRLELSRHRRIRSLHQPHHRHHPLPPLGVGYSDDRRFGDARMREEHSLHLGRVHVLATGDYQIFAPVEHVQVAIFVQHSKVTRAEPAIHEGARGCIGAVPVTRGHDRPAHEDLTPPTW